MHFSLQAHRGNNVAKLYPEKNILGFVVNVPSVIIFEPHCNNSQNICDCLPWMGNFSQCTWTSPRPPFSRSLSFLRHITVVLSPWEQNIFGRAGMMCSPWKEQRVYRRWGSWWEWWWACVFTTEWIPKWIPGKRSSEINCTYHLKLSSETRTSLRRAKILRSGSMPRVYKYVMFNTEFPSRQIDTLWEKALWELRVWE